MTTWLLLATAVLTEVAATVCLKLSNGFTRPIPAVMVVAGYLTSFVLLSQILTRGVSLAVVYAVWSALGVALIAVVDVLWFDDRLSAIQVVGLVLVVAGITAVELGGTAI